MPTSTLLQLVARGRQDAFLTGSPQVNFITHVYRRYTNFAIESIPIHMDGTPEFGRRITTVIPRKGDLLSALFLEVDLPPLPPASGVGGVPNYWVNDIGHAMIESVTIEIGDKEIDKHTGEWLNIWGELTTPLNHRSGYDQMVGHFNVYPPTDMSGQTLHLSIPLQFWFCTRIGAALPLIALQAHPVRLILQFRPFADLVWNETINAAIIGGATCSSAGIPSAPVAPSRLQLYGDYVFLDKDQQRLYATQKHAYLIEQLQISPVQSIPARQSIANVELNFNNSVKEFVWVIQQERMHAAREWFNFSNLLVADGGEPGQTDDLLESGILRLSGQDRFERRAARYFRLTQMYQHHTVIPAVPALIYAYSFALKPEDEQPSGTLNCSQFTDIQLSLLMNSTQLTHERRVAVYGFGYNILRIEGGLGGLMFIA